MSKRNEGRGHAEKKETEGEIGEEGKVGGKEINKVEDIEHTSIVNTAPSASFLNPWCPCKPGKNTINYTFSLFYS